MSGAKSIIKKIIPLCDIVQHRYPLFLFSGDVGTGKTVTAECVANRLVQDMKKRRIFYLNSAHG